MMKKEFKPDIYSIVTLHVDLDSMDTNIVKENRRRMHGFYKKQKHAIECVENNYGDIYENGYYNFVIIDPVSEGLYGCMFIDMTKFYKVLRLESGEYEVIQIDRPKCFEGIVGFGLG